MSGRRHMLAHAGGIDGYPNAAADSAVRSSAISLRPWQAPWPMHSPRAWWSASIFCFCCWRRPISRRIQSGFDPARAEQVLAVVARINAAIASYLRVKVLASLILAVPATIILWAFGVKSPLFWEC